MLGLIGTRSLDEDVPGIDELVDARRGPHPQRHHGLRRAADAARTDTHDAAGQARTLFDARSGDLGYALLLKRYVDDPRQATPADIQKAAWQHGPERAGAVLVVPHHGRPAASIFIALFALSFWLRRDAQLDASAGCLRLALWSLPLPWIAIELGWIVAEYGRQPWAIEGVLPTALGVSSVSSAGQVLTTLGGFVRVLHGAGGRRRDADAEVRSARGRTDSARRPEPRGRRRPTSPAQRTEEQILHHVSTTRRCA